MIADVERPAADAVQRRERWSAFKISAFEAVGGGVVCLLFGASLIGPIIAPASIYESNIMSSLEPPSAQHWLGTDDQGRDVFWRVIAGSRESLLSSMLIVAGYSSLGVLVATVAAVGGRWLDEGL